MASKTFLVVKGHSRWSITDECAFSFYNVITLEDDLEDINDQLIAYATEQARTVERLQPIVDEFLCYEKDIASRDSSLTVMATVVKRSRGGLWFGFIPQHEIRMILP